MYVSEIVFRLPDGQSLVAEPSATGPSVIPVPKEIGPASGLAAAVRQTLAGTTRTAAIDRALQIRVRLRDEQREVLVFDDGVKKRRSLVETVPGRENRLWEADTHRLSDSNQLERLLTRLASFFDQETGADLLPALAFGGPPASRSVSPKEQAYQRAYEQRRRLAVELKRINDNLSRPAGPNWLEIAVVVGATSIASVALLVWVPSLNRVVVPTAALCLIVYLLRTAMRTFRELNARDRLPERGLAIRQETEAIEEQLRDLRETLRVKGLDPDEVTERLLTVDGGPAVPSIISRESTSTQEVITLAGGRDQTIIFVDGDGVGGETFGDHVTPLKAEHAPPIEML